MMRSVFTRAATGLLVLSAASTAVAQTYPEIEPNATKAEATTNGTVTCMQAGESVGGTTTGTATTAASTLSTSVDTWRIKTCNLAPGVIYKHQLVLTTSGTAGHTGTIRGLNQTGTVGVGGTPGTTDTTIQTSSATTTPARMNQWYGFGRDEEIYYRVAGTVSTTAPYVATLSSTPVTPTNIGPFTAGSITITTVGQGHSNDTDIHVFDANLVAIPGWANDDAFSTTVLQSTLTRTFAAGTYYLAVSQYNVATNLPAAADDDFVTGALLDFPDAITQSATTANYNVSFAVTDGAGTTQFAATKPAAFDLVWFKLTVGGGGITAFCPGDGTQATACPCGNNGAAGRGCDNSAVTGGALLTATGSTSPDTIVLTSSDEIATASSVFLQGNALTSVVFGDGVRCAGGTLKRLYVKSAVAGTVSAPAAGDPSITAQSAALGDPIASGSTRYYQVYYRDPALAFCPAPPGNSWNVSSGLQIVW